MPNRYAKRRFNKRSAPRKRPFGAISGVMQGAYGGAMQIAKIAKTAQNVAKIVSHKGTGAKTSNKNNSKGKGVKVGSGQWACTAKRGRYRPVPKSIKDTTEIVNSNFQSTERIVNTAGRQAVGGIFANLWSLNDLQTVTNLPTTGSSVKHSMIKSGQLRAFGTNTSNNNVKVLIYNIVAKCDMTSGLFAVQQWAQGFADEGSVISNREYYGETPYGSSKFCSQWTVWKTTSFYLAEGESFMHNTSINLNKRIANSKLLDA